MRRVEVGQVPAPVVSESGSRVLFRPEDVGPAIAEFAGDRASRPTDKRELPDHPVSLAEAAAILGVATSTLRHQLRKGALEGTKVGREWVISPAELRRYRHDHQAVPTRGPATDLAISLIRLTAELARASDAALVGDREAAMRIAAQVVERLQSLRDEAARESNGGTDDPE
jgi:excisionase family DNA binding protein